MVKVLVTGASGFIAQHIVKILVERGYDVVGTVRSVEKGKRLQQHLQSEKFVFEVVQDISRDHAFDEVVRVHSDVGIVLHTASPFFYDTTNPEQDLIVPAIKGTTNILNAALEFGPGIRRLVITSSDAALYSAENEQDAVLLFDEESWNKISYDDAVKNPIAAYYGAKTFAEKAAWQFVRDRNPSFKLTAVNPVYVFGPQAFDSEAKGILNTSNEIIRELLRLNADSSYEEYKGSYIDVRDVAKAHVAAFENDNTAGRRLFLTNGQFSTQMILDFANQKFSQLRGKIPKGNPGSGAEDIKTLAQSCNKKTRQLLGFDFIPLDKIVQDTVSQILANQELWSSV